ITRPPPPRAPPPFPTRRSSDLPPRAPLQLAFRNLQPTFPMLAFSDYSPYFARPILVRWLSGRKQRFAKAPYPKRVPRVRIPPSPYLKYSTYGKPSFADNGAHPSKNTSKNSNGDDADVFETHF